MEQKQVVMSALSAGIGIGLGVGFLTAQSQTFRKWTSHGLSINYQELMELELTQQVIDGKSSDVTFDRFPYYISEQTRELLTSAAFVRLKRFQFTQYIRKLSPASSAILLSGPAEPCHQMLAKALAHHFDTKLLLLDATDFSLKLQRKHRGSTNSHDSKSLFGASIEHMTNFLESFSILPSSWAELKKLSSGKLIALEVCPFQMWIVMEFHGSFPGVLQVIYGNKTAVTNQSRVPLEEQITFNVLEVAQHQKLICQDLCQT